MLTQEMKQAIRSLALFNLIRMVLADAPFDMIQEGFCNERFTYAGNGQIFLNWFTALPCTTGRAGDGAIDQAMLSCNATSDGIMLPPDTTNVTILPICPTGSFFRPNESTISLINIMPTHDTSQSFNLLANCFKQQASDRNFCPPPDGWVSDILLLGLIPAIVCFAVLGCYYGFFKKCHNEHDSNASRPLLQGNSNSSVGRRSLSQANSNDNDAGQSLSRFAANIP